MVCRVLRQCRKGEAGHSGSLTRDVAAVKVVETYPREVNVDYLNLVKVAGRWRIMNKVYTTYARSRSLASLQVGTKCTVRSRHETLGLHRRVKGQTAHILIDTE